MIGNNFSISSSSSNAHTNRLIADDYKEGPGLHLNNDVIKATEDFVNDIFLNMGPIPSAIISQYEPRLAEIEFFREARKKIAPTNLWNQIANSSHPLISEVIDILKLRDTTPDIAMEKLFEAFRGRAGDVPPHLKNKQYDMLTLEEIISFAEFSQGQQDAALQTAWPSIRQRLNEVGAPMLPSATADVEGVRAWLANPAHEGRIKAVRNLDLGSLGLSAVPKEIRLFSELTSLSLFNNQIKNPPIDIFQELGDLERLGLQKNQIAQLSQGTFRGLGKLQYLSLDRNQIAHLPQGIFRGLGDLRKLDLQQNQIAYLPQGIFFGLPGLSFLRLDRNQIKDLPQGIFRGLGKLLRLDLQQNQIKDLPQGVFQGLSGLSFLYLNQNQIAHLPQGIFQGLGSLWHLDLDQNQIAHLPQSIFFGLPGLSFLHLGQNQIAHLPQGIFRGLGRLGYLGLQQNQIKDLSQDIFQGLPQLSDLHLEQNQIAHLPQGIFRGLGRLGAP